MIITITIILLTILLMILGIIFMPKINILNFKLSTFWVIPLIGSMLLIILKRIDFSSIINGLTEPTSTNPLKILTLFLSMTFLSIVLDELGFFKYLAIKAVDKIKSNQFVLFIMLYTLTSVLTIFTSNDIIILTFTPFIIFFCKNEHINPLPYLIGEFVSANTWSMLFIIGNPTNIYLATTFNYGFIEYLSIMWLPTLFAGISSLIILLIIFNKYLKEKIKPLNEEVKIENKSLLTIALTTLILCILFLIISTYISIEMWIISLFFAISLFIALLIDLVIRKNKLILFNSIKRIPYVLIPFIISMFIIVLTLNNYDLTKNLANTMGEKYPIIKYGFLTTFTSNLINNIPMSVFFGDVLQLAPISIQKISTFSTIIGSNIGAFLTPIGALAGIMWMNILKNHNVKFGFMTFVKYGVMIAIPTLLFSLLGLYIILVC